MNKYNKYITLKEKKEKNDKRKNIYFKKLISFMKNYLLFTIYFNINFN